jgi:hypothetical protein
MDGSVPMNSGVAANVSRDCLSAVTTMASNETLAEASMEIGVDRPEHDAELTGDRALRHRRIAFDRIQNAKHDGVVGRFPSRDPHLGL